MIYNESTKSFIKLETALKELGFDQQTIDLALEYLDITKPRNNDLMRKITTRYYPKLMQYSYREKLIKAVKSEISGSDSEELKDRYIIFSSMATGPYFRYMTEALSGNAYIYSENKAMYMKPLTDFYGENEIKSVGLLVAFVCGDLFRKLFEIADNKLTEGKTV